MSKIKTILFSKLSPKQIKILGIFAIFLIFFAVEFFIYVNKCNNFYFTQEVPLTLLKEKPKNLSPFSGTPCKNYKRRALGVIVAQYLQTMPLSGISKADIVIEGPTANPGGVTRLLLIFQCNPPKEVGSIRSVRPYMVDIALGYDVVLSSWGGASAAIKRIGYLGLDWFDARVNPSGAFFRKRNRYAPHNGFAKPSILWTAVKQNKMRRTNQFKGYKFLEKSKIKPKKTVQVINIDYYYPVKYVYDQKTGKYLRYWNNKMAIDLNTKKQAYANNLILMKTKQGVLSFGVADIKVLGSGTALIYQSGKVIKGKWVKKAPKSKVFFFDARRKEMKFVPGPTWIELVDKF